VLGRRWSGLRSLRSYNGSGWFLALPHPTYRFPATSVGLLVFLIGSCAVRLGDPDPSLDRSLVPVDRPFSFSMSKNVEEVGLEG
jgi:hypothetical protein